MKKEVDARVMIAVITAAVIGFAWFGWRTIAPPSVLNGVQKPPTNVLKQWSFK